MKTKSVKKPSYVKEASKPSMKKGGCLSCGGKIKKK